VSFAPSPQPSPSSIGPAQGNFQPSGSKRWPLGRVSSAFPVQTAALNAGPLMVAAPVRYQRQIRLVEVEVTRQMGFVWIARKLAVPGLLSGGQKVHGHPSTLCRRQKLNERQHPWRPLYYKLVDMGKAAEQPVH
jgi:hypothetical protein